MQIFSFLRVQSVREIIAVRYGVIKYFLFELFFGYFVSGEFDNCDVVFVISFERRERAEHCKSFLEIASLLQKETSQEVKVVVVSRRFRLFSFSNSFEIFLRSIERSNLSGLVVHCDTTVIENYLVSFAQKLGVKTASLQHGFYPVSSTSKVWEVEYRNSNSDCFIAWDYSTKNVKSRYVHVHQDIHVAGCWFGNFSHDVNKNLLDKIKHSGLIVFLPHQEHFSEFYMALAMASFAYGNCGISVKLKAHPATRTRFIEDFIGKFNLDFSTNDKQLIDPVSVYIRSSAFSAAENDYVLLLSSSEVISFMRFLAGGQRSSDDEVICPNWGEDAKSQTVKKLKDFFKLNNLRH